MFYPHTISHSHITSIEESRKSINGNFSSFEHFYAQNLLKISFSYTECKKFWFLFCVYLHCKMNSKNIYEFSCSYSSYMNKYYSNLLSVEILLQLFFIQFIFIFFFFAIVLRYQQFFTWIKWNIYENKRGNQKCRSKRNKWFYLWYL